MHYNNDDFADEFRRRFDESPPDLIEEIFNEIGNPLKRLQRLSTLVDQIINQLEHAVAEGGTEAQLIESYRQLPMSFDKIFHFNTDRRKTLVTKDFIALGSMEKSSTLEEERPRVRSQSFDNGKNEKKITQITTSRLDTEEEK